MASACADEGSAAGSLQGIPETANLGRGVTWVAILTPTRRSCVRCWLPTSVDTLNMIVRPVRFSDRRCQGQNLSLSYETRTVPASVVVDDETGGD